MKHFLPVFLVVVGAWIHPGIRVSAQETGARGYLGLKVVENAPTLEDIGEHHGVRVESVVENSPAQAAGIHPGDVIVSLGGKIHDWPDRFYAAYCSSKAALLSMTQCLHFDVQDTGIKIYAFSPGFTQTDMVQEIYSNDVFRQAVLTPDQGQPPERPAKVLTWLAREAPDDLAGQHVQVQFNDIGLRAGLEG